MTRDWRDWAPDLAVGVAVLLVGLFEAATTDVRRAPLAPRCALVVPGHGGGCGLSRRAPGVGLVLVWGTCGFQLLYGTDLMVVQLAVVAVAFGTRAVGLPGDGVAQRALHPCRGPGWSSCCSRWTSSQVWSPRWVR